MIFFEVASENQILSQTKLLKPIGPGFPAIEEACSCNVVNHG